MIRPIYLDYNGTALINLLTVCIGIPIIRHKDCVKVLFCLMVESIHKQ